MRLVCQAADIPPVGVSQAVTWQRDHTSLARRLTIRANRVVPRPHPCQRADPSPPLRPKTGCQPLDMYQGGTPAGDYRQAPYVGPRGRGKAVTDGQGTCQSPKKGQQGGRRAGQGQPLPADPCQPKGDPAKGDPSNAWTDGNRS